MSFVTNVLRLAIRLRHRDADQKRGKAWELRASALFRTAFPTERVVA